MLPGISMRTRGSGAPQSRRAVVRQAAYRARTAADRVWVDTPSRDARSPLREYDTVMIDSRQGFRESIDTIPEPQVLRVSASQRRTWSRLAELWDYRELLFFLAWRDVALRYRQTILGVAWALLQPLLTTIVLSVFLGRLAGMPSDGVPYPLFFLVGILPWQLFSFALTNSANSLVANERLLTRVYFPRIVVPVATVVPGLLDFCVGLALLVVVMIRYQVKPTMAVLALVPLVFLVLLLAIAAGIGLAALNVRYRDVRHTLPFLTQLWMFATPIAYPSSVVPPEWRALMGFNPMAGAVEGFRWALLGSPCPTNMLLISSLVGCLGLVASIWYFLAVERTIADII